MNFKPFGDRILVKVQEPETTTQSGIIIPDNANNEKPTQGVVISIGGTPKNIKEDDTVIFPQYAGTKITLEGEEYLILDTYKDILGVISK